ncbi:MAG: TVP38/TMEM64 family protein, partial [Thermoleophilia bacterium]|nr:TVP38/TMEM64 family protein [Thermoleophilia bacterium]
LAFVAVYLVRPLIFFSAAVLTVAGGFLFGAVGGIVLVVIAANGSAMVAYGLARWLGGERFADPEATGRLTRWTRRLRERSFETVIVMRLVYLPYDLVSYLAGALRIHPLAFLAGTAIGSAPATVAFVLFGASLESFDGGVPQIDGPVLIASGVMLVAGLAISHALRRRDAGSDAAA